MMEKTKLLFVINQFFRGGAETALLNLFRALPEQRYEVDFLVFDQIRLPGVIPLLPEVPEWVHVMDPAGHEGGMAFLKKAYFRFYLKAFHRQPFRKSVVQCLKGKRYDAVVSFGEWFSSRLAAEYVQARRKYVWIHADMDKAGFLHPDILRYRQSFDRFIFASERSMQGAEARYPVLRGCGLVIHNLVDEERIRRLSREPMPVPVEEGLPVLLTVANLREEKNHLRQVAVMKRLFRQGKRFLWLNAGNLANPVLVGRVQAAVREAGLERYFLLLGAVENPYPLMKRAAAVCVLSDHESWSMVITEAKTLGVPVIATRTSGAMEQLAHMGNGVLCDFTEEDIAEKIAGFLSDPGIRERLCSGMRGFSARSDTLERLEPLLQDSRRKAVYLFDNINYLSGARNAALEQMKHISSFAEVSLFSVEPCRDEALREQYRMLDLADSKGLKCLSTPCREVLGGGYSWKWKAVRLLYAVTVRPGWEQMLPQLMLKGTLPGLLNSYDVVCVVSEASRLRSAVSRLAGPKKVQWIHTDYTAWREQSAWTRAVTKHDSEIYSRFDTIVCLSESLKAKFTALYPHLREKTVVIPNFVRIKQIRKLAAGPAPVPAGPDGYNLITIGRMEREKRYDLVLRTAAKLKESGMSFHWYLAGDGPLLAELRRDAKRLGIDEAVFTGRLDNPYPLLKQCDALVLLSDYEGTPVTVDEAKALGVPVLARDVGGIREQLEDGRFGEIITDPGDAAGQIRGFLEKGCGTGFPGMESDGCQGRIAKALEGIFQQP